MAKKNTAKPHEAGELFEFETGAGTVRVPFIENLPRKVVRAMRDAEKNGTDVDEVLFELAMDEEAYAISEEMTISETIEFVKAWGEASTVSWGEF